MSDTQQQNTVHSTAQQTLYMLAAAGNSDAKMLIKNMGIDNSAMMKTRKAANNESFLSSDERENLMAGVTLAIEARYKAVSRLLKEYNFKNMLDIGYGYTPRALYCENNGINL